MKFSEKWLREWVNPPIDLDELQAQLTMAGHEIDSVTPAAAEFSGIVVGEVTTAEAHPKKEHLYICQVNIGKQVINVVCGADNVRVGLKVPTACIGSRLPDGQEIKKAIIEDVSWEGMLCSSKELGLTDTANGIFILPPDAPIGKDIRTYLDVEDYIIDVDLTPNRGDCLSIAGIAREIGVINRCELMPHPAKTVEAQCKTTFPVTLSAPPGCSHYVGRVIKSIDITAQTPLWMQEYLRRGGLRSINPVVDVTNYVMLELGQPMHAFDLAKLQGSINVRFAQDDETLELLDGQEIQLNHECLVIADEKRVLALAGIMGGEESGVNGTTKDIFLESAFFSPPIIAQRARLYGLHTDSSHRFERGVDPELQVLAVHRATQLLLEIVGGQAGPAIEVREDDFLPKPKLITLRYDRIKKLLGITVSEEESIDILQRLDFTVFSKGTTWEVHVPVRRFDVSLEVDLIEEIARIYGYNNFPVHYPQASLVMHAVPENKLRLAQITQTLIERGFYEVITYAFVDSKLQRLLDPNIKAIELLNPISQDMAEMRTSLLPGLITTLQFNLYRQRSQIQLFETGLRFIPHDDQLDQQRVIAGIATGFAMPEQWGVPTRAIDFYDVKAMLSALFELTSDAESFTFHNQEHPSLHPGQAACIKRDDKVVGWMGVLHPQIAQTLELTDAVIVFELLLDEMEQASIPTVKAVSKFPVIRRDLSLLVKEDISVQMIQDKIKELGEDLLQDIRIFDVYRGQGVASGYKSIALGLIVQHTSRTLTDLEVTGLIDKIILGLQKSFGITLRD